jgi:hypothetical protein
VILLAAGLYAALAVALTSRMIQPSEYERDRNKRPPLRAGEDQPGDGATTDPKRQRQRRVVRVRAKTHSRSPAASHGATFTGHSTGRVVR